MGCCPTNDTAGVSRTGHSVLRREPPPEGGRATRSAVALRTAPLDRATEPGIERRGRAGGPKGRRAPRGRLARLRCAPRERPLIRREVWVAPQPDLRPAAHGLGGHALPTVGNLVPPAQATVRVRAGLEQPVARPRRRSTRVAR
eukprot:scaffold283174_cov32-Tisochrysis_lutea.AAC.1